MRDPQDAARAAANDARTQRFVIKGDSVYVEKQWRDEPRYEEYIGKDTGRLRALLRALGFRI